MDIIIFHNVDVTDLPMVKATWEGTAPQPQPQAQPTPQSPPQGDGKAGSAARAARKAYADVRKALGRSLTDEDKAIVKAHGYDVQASVQAIGGVPQSPQVDPRMAQLQELAAQIGVNLGTPSEPTPVAQTTRAIGGDVPSHASFLSPDQHAALTAWSSNLVAPSRKSAVASYLAGQCGLQDVLDTGVKLKSLKRAIAV